MVLMTPCIPESQKVRQDPRFRVERARVANAHQGSQAIPCYYGLVACSNDCFGVVRVLHRHGANEISRRKMRVLFRLIADFGKLGGEDLFPNNIEDLWYRRGVVEVKITHLLHPRPFRWTLNFGSAGETPSDQGAGFCSIPDATSNKTRFYYKNKYFIPLPAATLHRLVHH